MRWKEMYRTLLVGVWLSSGRSNVKVPHLALQGVSTEFLLIGYILFCVISMILTPSKVRYISFQRNLQLKIHLSRTPKC